jgi:hypothetical protein
MHAILSYSEAMTFLKNALRGFLPTPPFLESGGPPKLYFLLENHLLGRW